MIITPKQMNNGYPVKAMRFMHSFNDCLSNEVDNYGIQKLDEQAIKTYDCEKHPHASEEIKQMYNENIKIIHAYLDKGGKL